MKKLILNNKINTSVFAFIIAVSANSSSHATVNSTYIGADVIYTKTRFQSGFGDNVFSKKMAPGVNLFAGLMFNKYLGGEIGFEVDDPNSDINYAAGSEAVFGVANNNASLIYSGYQAKINQNHLYFGLIAKTNIFDKNFFSILIGGSVSHIKARANLFGKYINFFGGEFIPTDAVYTFDKNKLIPIVKIKFGYKCNDNSNINLSSTWKKTSKINITSQESSGSMVKLKNSINVGLGFSYYIV